MSDGMKLVPCALPEGDWQAEAAFPDREDGEPVFNAAVSGCVSFRMYRGQGKAYFTVSKATRAFAVRVNGIPADTSAAFPGSVCVLDFASAAKDGINTIRVSCLDPGAVHGAVTVRVAYPEVIEGTPESVGIPQACLTLIDDIVTADVAFGFPSAQLAIIRGGRMVFRRAWGKVRAYRPDGTPDPDSPAATNGTLYDLASNTKMYAAVYPIQYLTALGRFDPDARVADILGPAFYEDVIDIAFADHEHVPLATQRAWKAALTVRDLMTHQAGFPPDPRYHHRHNDQRTQKRDPNAENVLWAGLHDTREAQTAAVYRQICRTPLMYEPGTRTVYSDVDYMLLGLVLEKVSGRDLDTLLKELFFRPLGLSRITFNPLKNGFAADDCAATELRGNTRDGASPFPGARTRTLQGEVHDEKAWHNFGGIAGHAGLFADAQDLARLASLMLTGGCGARRFFPRAVIDAFTAPKKWDAEGERWGMGWWRSGDCRRPRWFGTAADTSAVGHQGWTGTLTCIDPARQLVTAYLTNKIHTRVTDPARDPDSFRGSWYTSASLGFVNQLLEEAIDCEGDVSALMTEALGEMAAGRFRTIAWEEKRRGQRFPADHPAVRAACALAHAAFTRAERTRLPADIACAERITRLPGFRRDEALAAAFDRRLAALRA